jgi:hypothetical protein
MKTLEFYGFPCYERYLWDLSILEMFELLEHGIECNYVFIMQIHRYSQVGLGG